VAILTAVIFGIVPAIQASNPDLVGSLKNPAAAAPMELRASICAARSWRFKSPWR
jgi:hypothetical protein